MFNTKKKNQTQDIPRKCNSSFSSSSSHSEPCGCGVVESFPLDVRAELSQRAFGFVYIFPWKRRYLSRPSCLPEEVQSGEKLVIRERTDEALGRLFNFSSCRFSFQNCFDQEKSAEN